MFTLTCAQIHTHTDTVRTQSHLRCIKTHQVRVGRQHHACLMRGHLGDPRAKQTRPESRTLSATQRSPVGQTEYTHSHSCTHGMGDIATACHSLGVTIYILGWTHKDPLSDSDTRAPPIATQLNQLSTNRAPTAAQRRRVTLTMAPRSRQG